MLMMSGQINRSVRAPDVRAAAHLGPRVCVSPRLRVAFGALAMLGLLSPVGGRPPPPAAERDVRANAFAGVIDKALPAVVKIYGAGAGSRVAHFGTGVLVSAEGHILTLYSAMLTEDLASGIQPKVVLADGREFKARVHFRSRALEAAMIKIEAAGLPYLTPADSDKVRPGHWMVMIGNAFNLAGGNESPSVNLGVLSAVVDKLDASVRIGAGDYRYQGRAFITDANNNPGSYGGPMLTIAGEWVGLTGRIVASNLTNTQINYGVPINDLKEFLAAGLARKTPAPDSDFKPSGKPAVRPVVAGYHGIHLFADGGQLAKPFVDRLERRSPAREAGLRADDLIVYVDATLVQTVEQFRTAMSRLPAGADVVLTVERGRDPAAKQTLKVGFKLGEAPK
jgi:serine protease Do